MKIITPILEKYRKGDIAQYFYNVLEIITEDRATTLQIANQRSALATTMDSFKTNWQQVKGSELTPQIAELDAQRDSSYIGLKLTVDTWASNHFDDSLKNAAFLIADKLATYGNRIQTLRYQEETATLNAIINDLETDLAPQVTQLGLTDWVAQLKNLNTSFNEKYVLRAQDLSTEQDGLVAEIRIQATNEFKLLKDLFVARGTVAIEDAQGNAALFTTVANEWNTLTEQYNAAVLRNTGSTDIPTDTTEEPTTEAPSESE